MSGGRSREAGSDRLAEVKADVPFTGRLNLSLVPKVKVDFQGTVGRQLSALENELDIRGHCTGVPDGTTGVLHCEVIRELSAGGHGRTNQEKELFLLPVKLALDGGSGARPFKLKAIPSPESQSEKVILHAVKHGLWSTGHVALTLQVNIPHAPLTPVQSTTFTFDNPLHVRVDMGQTPLMGAAATVVPVVAPCFDNCPIVFSPFEQDVSTRDHREYEDQDDYRDEILFGPRDHTAAKTWLLGFGHGGEKVLYAETREAGSYELAYDVFIWPPGVATTGEPGERAKRKVVNGTFLASVPVPKLTRLELATTGLLPGSYEVSGQFENFDPDVHLELEIRAYRFDGHVVKANDHGHGRTRLDPHGAFKADLNVLGASYLADLGNERVGYLMAVAVAPEHLARPTPMRDLATFDTEQIRPLAHYVGATLDRFAIAAVASPCLTLRGTRLYPPVLLITEEQLRGAMPHAPPERVRWLLADLQRACAKDGLDTPLQIVHFLARVAVETGELRDMVENQPRNYQGRLGNDEPGDGVRYRGRGLIQLTGKDNYKALGKGLFEDENAFLGNEKAALLETDPKWATRSATWFWANHRCLQAAASDSLVGVIRAVNPGQTNVETHWKFLQLGYEAFHFSDRAARVAKNIEEMKKEGYTYMALREAP